MQKVMEFPMIFSVTETVQMTIHKVELFKKPTNYGDIGTIRISDNTTNEIEDYAIWFEEEGNHYVCFPIYDDDELETFLLEDILS